MIAIIEQKVEQLIKDLNKSKRPQQVLKKLVESIQFQSWVYLDSIIELKIQTQADKVIQKLLVQSIKKHYFQVKSFPMFMFLYSLEVENRLNGNILVPWSKLYNQVCIKNNQVAIFNSWVFNQQSHKENFNFIQNTLQMIAKSFSLFLKNCKIPFSDIEFESIIKWIMCMQTQTIQKFQLANNLAQTIKNIHVKNSLDYISKEHMILKMMIENLGNKINNSGNAFLLLQNDKYQQKNINYFCHIYYDFLTDLNQNHLCNIFMNLIAGGCTKQMLIIIEKISNLIQNDQEFYKLRHIYQNFIIPVLTKAKAHIYYGNEIFKICQYFILGFLRHCEIGQEGFQYVIDQIQHITDKDIQQKWIQLAFILGESSNRTDQLKQYLKKSKIITNKNLEEAKKNLQIDRVWQITLRSGKKHKKYTKINSNLKGIQNKANQCYIISVVQGLFMTGHLSKLLDQFRVTIKGKLELLDQLRILFSELDGRRKADKIVISYLKRKGPQVFRSSQHQQDAMQYLIQLLEAIQKQCESNAQLAARFKSIFQIDCKSITKCQKCQHQMVNIQNQYIHTIPHTKILQLKVQQNLQDYACTKCSQKNCKNTRILTPTCSIFIVHINRFSHKKGVLKKQISNQTILRKFKNYELIGMICHIGKSVQNGHYVYFSKIEEKKWAEMNDRLTSQFELENEDQQFEREMKNDLSPYILFYKKI